MGRNSWVLKRFAVSADIVTDGLFYLNGLQSADGSWYGSSYQTALAVDAIWAITSEPDLSVRPAEITVNPPVLTSLPTEVVITASVRNLGLEDVEAVKVAFYRGHISDESLVEEQIISLPGQGRQDITLTQTIDSGERHLYYVVIDPDNQVKESSETNNTALKVVDPELSYDFEILHSSLQVEPATVDMLQPVTITVDVHNSGTTDAFNVTLRYFLDLPSNAYDLGTVTMDIPAGTTVSREFAWNASLAGEAMPLTVSVDPNNAFAELSELNNESSAPLTVNTSTEPNLTVRYEDIDFSKEPAEQGQPVTISAVIRNEGFADVQDVAVVFYTGEVGPDAELLGSETIEFLAAGSDSTATVDWTPLTSIGPTLIRVEIDPDGQVQEISEEDNSAFRTLTVPPCVRVVVGKAGGRKRGKRPGMAIR